MIRRTAAAVLALAVINIATIAPANAHEGLVSSTPASDSALTQSPTEVSLTFTSEPLDVGSSITVVDSSGETWGDAEPVRDGVTLTQPLRAPLPSGTYEVRWRAVSGDGHPISDSFSFTVDAGSAMDTPPVPTSTPEPAPSGSVDEGGPISFGVLLLAGLGAVVLVVLIRGVVRSRRGRA